MLRQIRRPIVLLAIAVAAAPALAGCGADDDGGAATANTERKARTVAVPAAIKAKGTLTAATDATYPPIEFVKPGQSEVVGLDADLADALSDVMGIDIKVVNVPFDGIIPGLASGKYDIGLAALTDTKEREQTVDFVTYFKAGTSFFVRADGGPAINVLNDLCGHSVAAQKGTIQAAQARSQSNKCKYIGQPKVKLMVFPDQNGANLALASGRAEVGMADSPVAAYLVKQSSGKFKLSGKTYDEAPYGIAVPKDSGLQKPLRDALRQLIADGRYRRILEKWGLQGGAISEPVINGAES